MTDVVILTDPRYVNPTEVDHYNQNVLLEDRLVQKALEKQGLKVLRLSWDNANFDWTSAKYILFRSTWDYFDRYNEFSTWLKKVSAKTKLLNSADIILWNIDKHYLQDLQDQGVHCIPSHYIEVGFDKTLAQLHQENNWTETILKPVISGAARHTYKLTTDSIAQHESIFKTLIQKETLMLQPFQNSIVEKGEVSFTVIDGQYTHAVLKVAKKGDFRVQDDFGGSVYEYAPSKKEIEFAEKAIQACKELPIYARVDICIDNDGELALVELELIEPELWFRNNPKAADSLANAIHNLLKHNKSKE